MARPRLSYDRVRVRLDGYIPVGIDPKDDELLAKLKSLPPRTKFPTVWMWLKMGKALETIGTDTPDDEVLRLVREAEAASKDFFERFEDDE